jgi:hypothetical protein
MGAIKLIARFVGGVAVGYSLMILFCATWYGIERNETYRGVVISQTNPNGGLLLDADSLTNGRISKVVTLSGYHRSGSEDSMIFGWLTDEAGTVPMLVKVRDVERCVEWRLYTTNKRANPLGWTVLYDHCEAVK